MIGNPLSKNFNNIAPFRFLAYFNPILFQLTGTLIKCIIKQVKLFQISDLQHFEFKYLYFFTFLTFIK